MNRTLIRYLLVGIVSAGLVAPAHAFDIRAWFNALSGRSRSALYLGAATVVAGLGLLAYKLCWKKKAQPTVQAVRSEPESQMKEMSAAQQRLLADTSLPMNGVTGVETEAKPAMGDVASIVQVQSQQYELKRSAAAGQLHVAKAAPKKVLKKVSAKNQPVVVSTMVRDYDINQDKDLIVCKENYEHMCKLCEQALERVKKAIADKNYEQAKQQHTALLSTFKQEQQKVYKQVIDLLETVKKAISQEQPLSPQMSARKWLLVPWKAEIERLEYYFNKTLATEIEEMNKKLR